MVFPMCVSRHDFLSELAESFLQIGAPSMRRLCFIRVNLFLTTSTISDFSWADLLQSVLLAPIRFHDTMNRGRLLNRFGKDFEGIDSSLIDSLGR
jgi:hypothetical protein